MTTTSNLRDLSPERLAALARLRARRTGIVRVPRDGGPLPCSFEQRRMWLAEQVDPDAAVNVTAGLAFHGPLDLDALRTAVTALVSRHEVLRTVLVDVEGEPWQQVLPEIDPPLTVVDLSGADDGEARAETLARRAAGERFDRARAPLFRAHLYRLADEEHRLMLVWHHATADGWSVDNAVAELAATYRAAVAGTVTDLPELSIQYADYAAWSRSRFSADVLGTRLTHWRELLAEPPTALHPGSPAPGAAGSGEVVLEIPAELAVAVQRAGGPRTTPYAAFLTAYQALLARLTGDRTVTVGTVTGGRGRTELEPLIGCFINLLPLRTELDPVLPFRDAAARVRSALAVALANEVPFDELTSALDTGRGDRVAALFQSAVVWQQAHTERQDWSAELAVEWWDRPLDEAAFDLALIVRELPTGYQLCFRYRRDRFAAPVVEQVGALFRVLLEAIAAAPDAPLADHDLLTAADRQRLADWNATGTVAPPWPLLHRVIDGHDPAAAAVVFGDTTLTYGDLATDSTRLAHHLRRSVVPDRPVGICLEQSAQTAIALFGVLKAGAPYLPLDPEAPDRRLEWLLADSGAPTLVTTSTMRPRFAGYPGRIVCLDTDPWRAEPATALPETTTGADLAYVVYTSGSTGTPKGVAVQHRQVLNYLEGVRQRFEIVPGATFGLMQSLSFDFGITTFYLALAAGGTVRMIPRRASGAELADVVAGPGLDYLKLTPSHLAALADDVGAAALLPRRALILGGEASTTAWARELARLGTCAVHNHYGPTEATVGVTTWRVTDDGEAGATSPIGRPLPGARIHLLDEGLRPVPPGTVGEICIGGDRLARGYLGRPELTAERFVAAPLVGEDRVYRTGDLGRHLPDGAIEFLGRRDHQVKIRGYRVELGEIEAALAGCAGVSRAVVVVREDRLVAYLEGTLGTPASELRAELAERLPDYMVPGRFVWLPRLPLQAHGKVDRARLPEPAEERSTDFVAPDGPLEETIAQVWAAVLKVDRVGALDDFFDLGGHSLLATQVVARLRKELPRPVTVVELFREPTVRALARLAAAEETGERPLLHELTRRGGVPPTRTYVCVPYGGASAVVFQPLADALPAGNALLAVAVPGHELAVEEETQPIETVAQRCVAEILESVTGPLVLYGHCGPGAALTLEIARTLQAAGRPVEAVYLGGVFPFARPDGKVLGPLYRALRIERLRSDAVYANWLQSIGADVGDGEQRRFLVRTMRRDAELAEEYFTRLLAEHAEPLTAPIICVVGEKDPGTEFYRERYREWNFLTSATGLVVLDEAGHYFLRYRAEELAGIVTTVHLDPPERQPDDTWWVEAAVGEPPRSGGAAVAPSMGRFLTVAAGQMVSMIGTALTEYAVPLWVYLQTGSITRFTLFALVALLPGLVAAPLIGALVDRGDRRKALLASGIAAGTIQAVLLTQLVVTGDLGSTSLYLLLAALSVALTAQRLAYGSAVPQLIPKRYMGHANGVVQFTMGIARFMVPVFAVALMAAFGLQLLLLLDVLSYVAATAVLLLVRFPSTLPWRPREDLLTEIRHGFSYLWVRPGLRAMVGYFFVLNVLLGAVFVLISPLALSVGDLADAGWVAMIAGIGATVGGAAMALWGGPRRRRMTGMLVSTLCFAAFCAVTGLRPSLPVIAVGVFGMCLMMAVVDGIWMTVIHTKVPHRFHARVLAVNQAIAMSTQPLGFIVVAPLAPALGPLLGTTPARGIGLLYLLCGLAIAVWTVAALRFRPLARFDRDTPDAAPDDVVGLEHLAGRRTRVPV
ncbi:non-ribosomal peptide synthetase/MFS transporter [Pseudonocardia sp. CA-107938]|uniref:non-ribosomal peptide synthetase/MFS transporter n=1 Tax=Pseudonocardia sp. CA-107938 TaxID=3240021 RepID=UPI003D92809A